MVLAPRPETGKCMAPPMGTSLTDVDRRAFSFRKHLEQRLCRQAQRTRSRSGSNKGLDGCAGWSARLPAGPSGVAANSRRDGTRLCIMDHKWVQICLLTLDGCLSAL